MINRVLIKDEIHSYLNNLVQNRIGESEISLFLAKAKSIVEYAFDDYINRQFSKNICKVVPNKESAYSSFTDGYVSKMKRWTSNNGIKLNPIHLSDVQVSAKKQDSSNKSKAHIAIAIGGTALALSAVFIPKFISRSNTGNSSLTALAIELITLGLSYYSYKSSCVKQNNVDRNSDLTNSKERLFELVWSQIALWLDKAEKESDNLLNQYFHD